MSWIKTADNLHGHRALVVRGLRGSRRFERTNLAYPCSDDLQPADDPDRGQRRVLDQRPGRGHARADPIWAAVAEQAGDEAPDAALALTSADRPWAAGQPLVGDPAADEGRPSASRALVCRPEAFPAAVGAFREELVGLPAGLLARQVSSRAAQAAAE